MALGPVAEGRGGCSGDVLNVVGDVHRTAGAEDLVEAFHEVRLLRRGPLLDGSLGEFVRGHVLEVDPAAGHLGDGRDLLARGQGLRAGEQVPLACVAVAGEDGHRDACDVFRVHHGEHAVAGRVGDLAGPDGVAPGEGVGREGAGPQVGHAEAGLAQDLLAGREGGPHGVAVQRQQPRAGRREQHDPRHRRVSRGGDHRLGLPGPGSDLHQEDGLGAGDRFGHACGIVEITDGELDPRQQAGRTGRIAHQRADAVPLFVQLPRDSSADVAGCSSDQIHLQFLSDRWSFTRHRAVTRARCRRGRRRCRWDAAGGEGAADDGVSAVMD